ASIKRTHVVRLGYRESSSPFSFLDQANRPIGYSLELCEAIVDEIGVEVDDSNLRIDYVKVTSEDRIAAVVQSKIDLECGSTTANADRAKQVAFSPLIFVAGTKLMVPMVSSISAPADRRGTTVVVMNGFTCHKGEPQLTAVLERTFQKLGSKRDLIPVYSKWFVARLPTGEKLNVAISPQLEEAFKALNHTEGSGN